VVAYTCRYSSGPLNPNSATAIDWNIGINCPLEYLQVYIAALSWQNNLKGGIVIGTHTSILLWSIKFGIATAFKPTIGLNNMFRPENALIGHGKPVTK